MPPVITAFAASPDRGRGLARDMTVRWALEEVGQPYDLRLLSFAEMKQDAHMAAHPFGQIPTFEDDGVVLFESGAIVLHIGERHPGLLPEAPDARIRAITWMFAALSSVEPVILERATLNLLERDRDWYGARLPLVQDRIRQRLEMLSQRIGVADWLDGGFSAGDLLMVQVLRRLSASGLLAEFPNVQGYVARGEARPAFTRAFEAQFAVFEASLR